MTMTRYERTTTEIITRVTGGDVAELRAACIAHDFTTGTKWAVEDDAIIISKPEGVTLVGVE